MLDIVLRVIYHPLVNLLVHYYASFYLEEGMFSSRNFQIYQSNSPHHPRYIYYAILHFGLRRAFKLPKTE